MKENQAQRGRGTCPGSHSTSLQDGWGWRFPRVGPLGQAALCSSLQETAVFSSRGSREEKLVWLRDWQALEAEPGPVPGKQPAGVGIGWRPPGLEKEVAEGWPSPKEAWEESEAWALNLPLRR